MLSSIRPGSLAGKVALVTGAARGIGRSVAVAMAREGAFVAGADICAPMSDSLQLEASSSLDLDETGRLVIEQGGRWLGLVYDQRDIAAVRDAAVRVEEIAGKLNILVANAGVQAFKPILEMEDEDWNVQIDVNLTGTANVIRVFAPLLIRAGAGRIIVTSSTQGRHGTKFGSAYSASKWGLFGLAKSAALELGEHGVTVNILVPGLIDTPLTRRESRYSQAIQVAGKTPTGHEDDDEALARSGLIAKSPLGVPWIDPDDVAPMAVFLASDAARMITGASFEVTGGDSANMP